MGYLGVECHDALQCLLHAPFKLCSHGFILFLMFLKPFTVVVGHHLPQELQNAFLIHRLFVFANIHY